MVGCLKFRGDGGTGVSYWTVVGVILSFVKRDGV